MRGEGALLFKAPVLFSWFPSFRGTTLRNLVGLGIDCPKEPSGSQEGHKLKLKHAQDRAIKEVNQGKQRLLVRVLRENKNPFLGFLMKILSLNVQSLGDQAKKLALKRIINLNSSKVVFIQELMGSGDSLVRDLRNMFVYWEFIALDAQIFLGGLITSWSSKLILFNSFIVFSSLCTNFFSHSFGMNLSLMNIYGPYEGKEEFWSNFLSHQWIKFENLILGGDLNFTLNRGEIWGSFAHHDNWIFSWKNLNLLDRWMWNHWSSNPHGQIIGQGRLGSPND
jgi:hypothetical protein